MIRRDTARGKLRKGAGPVLILLILLSLVVIPGYTLGNLREEGEHDSDTVISVPPPAPAPVQDEPRHSTGAETVVLADSTAALGEGKTLPGSVNNCTHSADAWPALLAERSVPDLVDLSCAGTRTKTGISNAKKDYVGEKTSNVIVSYGSNDLSLVNKNKRNSEDVRGSLSRLIDTIRDKSDARIILNGYVEFNNDGCGKRFDTRRVRAVKDSHSMVNDEMRALANENPDVVFVDPPVAPRLCDPDTIIVPPDSDAGFIWHNNSRAHELIADRLMSEILPLY